MNNWTKYLNYSILTDITASASISISVVFNISTTITVSSSLTNDGVFGVAVSLILFIFVLSRVLLKFLPFMLSIISFDGFGQVISLAYFGRRGPHFFHSSTAFIGSRGVGCNTYKSRRTMKEVETSSYKVCKPNHLPETIKWNNR